MQTAHQAALETKHAGLERRIVQEHQRPVPDPVALASMKKQKLRLKEEIASI